MDNLRNAAGKKGGGECSAGNTIQFPISNSHKTFPDINLVMKRVMNTIVKARGNAALDSTSGWDHKPSLSGQSGGSVFDSMLGKILKSLREKHRKKSAKHRKKSAKHRKKSAKHRRRKSRR
tara:strand:+ start:471 stop:833 length:363 start_codon:yes stop_codon:yes gene_type:complete